MEYKTTLSTKHPDRGIVITIGNFDGMHRGHQFLLRELRQQAEALDCIPVMLTFTPHTMRVVRPEINFLTLTTTEEKLALAREICSITESIVITFTPAVIAMTATQFFDELRAHYPIKGLVLGEDARLGRDRESDVTFVQAYGKQHGLTVKILPLKHENGERISSTRIRKFISEGNITTANALLGHPVRISGRIEHGEKRGRLLGFPTANLHSDHDRLYPADGIYAVHAYVQEDIEPETGVPQHIYQGAAYVGTNPTFAGTERRLEVHLLDTDIDLYGKHLVVDFIAHVRGDRQFAGSEDLQKQIFTHDLPQTRVLLAQATQHTA
jgi:riboflavin kinase / FMN adenylyltransferase